MKPHEMLTLAGAIAVAIAAIARFAELRRLRRNDLDRVGWMPWTGLFFVALMAAVILLGLAAREWAAG
ncbi:MAG: hypothetical protein KDE25_02170 [Novosphingobium sp.]|nr:hypothetical protein [Novosphingobium sp.]